MKSPGLKVSKKFLEIEPDIVTSIRAVLTCYPDADIQELQTRVKALGCTATTDRLYDCLELSFDVADLRINLRTCGISYG